MRKFAFSRRTLIARSSSLIRPANRRSGVSTLDQGPSRGLDELVIPLAALLVVLALTGCAQGATGQAGAPRSQRNSCSFLFYDVFLFYDGSFTGLHRAHAWSKDMPPAFRVGRVTLLVSLAGCLRGHPALFCDKGVAVGAGLVRDLGTKRAVGFRDMITLTNSTRHYSMTGRDRLALQDNARRRGVLGSL